MARQQYPPGQEPWRDFTLWLQREMQNSGKAQRQLADEVGVTQSQVSRWLAGDFRPRPDLMEKIARVFGINKDILLHLAGYEANIMDVPSGKLSLEAELELESATSFFENLLRNEVPRPLWASLRTATGSMGRALAELASSLPEQQLAPPQPPVPEKRSGRKKNVPKDLTALSVVEKALVPVLSNLLNARDASANGQLLLNQNATAHRDGHVP